MYTLSLLRLHWPPGDCLALGAVGEQLNRKAKEYGLGVRHCTACFFCVHLLLSLFFSIRVVFISLSAYPEIVFESGGSTAHVLASPSQHGLHNKHILCVNDISREQVSFEDKKCLYLKSVENYSSSPLNYLYTLLSVITLSILEY